MANFLTVDVIPDCIAGDGGFPWEKEANSGNGYGE